MEESRAPQARNQLIRVHPSLSVFICVPFLFLRVLPVFMVNFNLAATCIDQQVPVRMRPQPMPDLQHRH
jgi:hypothetical protein